MKITMIKIPKKSDLTHKKCVALLKEHEVPRIIFLHSRKVNAISMLIASKLKEKGIDINLHLVDMGSLLHDIAKHKTIKIEKEHGYRVRHTIEGYNILITKGYPFEARVAFMHGLDIINDKFALKRWEDIIVYYADKRVNKDKVISLDERLLYLKRRYGKISNKVLNIIKSVEKPLKELEKQIFKNLDIKPEDINESTIKPFLVDEKLKNQFIDIKDNFRG